MSTGDKKLIGEATDALNRQNSKYLTESGFAKMTDLELVEEFNTLRSIASHNRQTGGDYLTYTRKAMKLVPEMNKRGITKAYYPTHDDLTYTLVTDSDRARNIESWRMRLLEDTQDLWKLEEGLILQMKVLM